MATASEAVEAAYKKNLGRSAGATGKAYWVKTWETDYQNAIGQGKTAEEAEALASAATDKHLAASTEGKGYAKHNIAKTSYEGTADFESIDKTPKWYESSVTAKDPNEYITGTRDEDWSTKLSSSNLENYADTLNYQYGQYQGNVVGQEGLEWWGYQKDQAIDHYMSDAGGNYSFATASKIADHDIAINIMENTGHQNYKKFGTIGYGNPLEIKSKTEFDLEGNPLVQQKYLELDSKTELNPTGTKIATQYQIDEDGEFVLDDDGNKIATGDTATPYEWQYVKDDTAPGGYRITAVPFFNSVKDSTKGHDWHMANYEKDGATPGVGGANPFTIPSNVQNIDPSLLTSTSKNKLDIYKWADTPQGQNAIAADNFKTKNKWFKTSDGKLLWTDDGIDHSKWDSNLGLADGQKHSVNWGGGYVTDLSGKPVETGYVPPVPIEEQQMLAGGGGGATYINLDQNQKSTTAADKATKFDDRVIASGQGRRGYTTGKYQPTGNIRQLGIVS